MMTIAVTFDFHNTLATCDRWFEVEIHTLVPEVLRWCDIRLGTAYAHLHGEEARRVYREIRNEVIRVGEEIDAVSCARLVIGRLNLPLDQEMIGESVDAVMRATLSDTKPVPGAVEAIHFLAARGVPVGVVSSAVHHQFLEWTLNRFGIGGAIAEIITSASSGYYKSRTEIYASAVHRLGVEPGQCVHIGDSYQFDVVTASNAGLRTIWFRRDPSDGGGSHPNLVVDSLVGVAPLALGLLGEG